MFLLRGVNAGKEEQHATEEGSKESEEGGLGLQDWDPRECVNLNLNMVTQQGYSVREWGVYIVVVCRCCPI